MNTISTSEFRHLRRDGADTATGLGLWVFICMASVLFALFIVSYAMRMTSSDWSPIGMPWQLWLSSALLAAGSITLHGAGNAGRHQQMARMRTLFQAGGAFACLFVAAQLWAWQALLAERIGPTGNPAASFFYLLTAVHALHVAGGLVAWTITAHQMRGQSDLPRAAVSVSLCARYWHFLFAVWVVLFATLALLTPEIVRYICGLD